MASLNLSINGPSIKSSYNGVVNDALPASDSPTRAQWALFTVQAPLVNAFQDSGAKESILKVQSTGDGELADLIEDFSEGRVQFAFVKVKDPNTALPKCILIAWCGGGVPERTKGYFTSHTAAVAKVLHGYHVQITARSDADLEPESIMKKVADASGAKYSAASSSSGAMPAAGRPPVKSKPVFTPTMSTTGRSVNPLVAARSRRDTNVDQDGWGDDAPPVTRTQLERVEPAYRPIKVNMNDLASQKAESSRLDGSTRQQDNGPNTVVKGAYQPVGKVDIAAIRAAAKQEDYRPSPVKGAYEPVGKVDIAAIRARAQKPTEEADVDAPAPTPLADRATAFSQPSQSERIMSLPKPKVANKFGGASFAGTKAPVPGGLGFGTPSASLPAPAATTSRTFADQGGKTPAQLWAEKKARERGASASSTGGTPSATSPIAPQPSGGWKSGYSGKSWAPVQAPGYGRSAPEDVVRQDTGDATHGTTGEGQDMSAEGVAVLKDRFKQAAPPSPQEASPASRMSPQEPQREFQTSSTSISRPSGGFALPGLPSRPPPPTEEEQEEEYQHSEEEAASPIRVAVPVAREADAKEASTPLTEAPTPPSGDDVPREKHLPDEEETDYSARRAAAAVAEQNLPVHQETAYQAEQGGKSALIQYDYDKAEDNEIDLIEGELVTNIDMVDEDWWMGTNSKGESGLFPSNYVELIDDEGESAGARAPAPELETRAASHTADAGDTATAMYDYEAAEDNELSFPEDAVITNLEFPDEDWWFGHYDGQSGLFPANYVQLKQ
ncbi:hypothetical protein CDD81_2405 [Ophiocordyceps australis]|uniref:SH3 domain-containing protein n=1 Tax=Ophiocordyceps australis TaxID=1399860 RepID=A0A2C5XWU0_9HYPO|nr:hypothetical protein CDD81_2405 [Ophiocordyceps australis]